MIDFIHNYIPDATIVSFGSVQIYWYGFFIVIGILSALSISLKLAKKSNLSQNNIFDLAFWIIIFGILGARIYHIFLEIGYYLENLLDIIKIWEGGLAIHGAIIAGAITVDVFCRKQKMNFWQTCAIIAPGIALAQTIGRFGNYFNQELFGRPTDLPWGIPIEILKRPHRYIGSEHFHPTFLYESLGNLLVFAVLMFLLFHFLKRGKKNYEYIIVSYLVMYSILRFLVEFIRIDITPYLFGLRFPQVMSLLIIIVCIAFIVFKQIKKRKADIDNDGSSPKRSTSLS